MQLNMVWYRIRGPESQRHSTPPKIVYYILEYLNLALGSPQPPPPTPTQCMNNLTVNPKIEPYSIC